MRLNLPTRIINCIIDFLSNGSQRIKLSEGCYSEWGSVPSGVPQGTKLGPWLFLVLINDLYVDDLANVWKYVDDTTASEVVAKGNRSCPRNIANKVVEWSMQNWVKVNSEKCKELRISFVKNEPQFAPIVVDGKELERVTSAKLLGLTISSNLTWNEHISDVIKKASVFFSAVKKIKSSSAWYVHFLHCLYTLFSYLRSTCLFLCLAKVPKRRVGASWEAGNVYNMPRTALPGDHRTSEHCPYCRFHHGAM